jgi:hypothetical protein
MKTTRIFNVEYYVTEVFNGKKEGDPIKENQNIVAKDAGLAVGLVLLQVEKEINTFRDDETGKMVKATRTDFDPINITLQAEA